MSTSISHDESKEGEKRRLYFGYGSNLWREQMALRCPDSQFLGMACLRGYRWMINERGYANVAKSESQPAKVHDSAGESAPDEHHNGSISADPQAVDKKKENSKGDVVWGAVYSLTPADEARLDVNEGVPYAYEKRDIERIEFWSVNKHAHLSNPVASGSESVPPLLTPITSGAKYSKYKNKNNDKSQNQHIVEETEPEIVSMLVYIDFQRTNGDGSKPREEYIHRMNMGIRDALEAGMPRDYVDGVLRRWIPEEEGEDDGDDDGNGAVLKSSGNKKEGVTSKAKELALRQARAFKDESGVIPPTADGK